MFWFFLPVYYILGWISPFTAFSFCFSRHLWYKYHLLLFCDYSNSLLLVFPVTSSFLRSTFSSWPLLDFSHVQFSWLPKSLILSSYGQVMFSMVCHYPWWFVYSRALLLALQSSFALVSYLIPVAMIFLQAFTSRLYRTAKPFCVSDWHIPSVSACYFWTIWKRFYYKPWISSDRYSHVQVCQLF